MKLYTEEQVIEFTMNMISQYEFGNKDIWNKELLKESFQYITPIELPSDKKIDAVAEKTLGVSMNGFRLGAKWLKEQILKQTK